MNSPTRYGGGIGGINKEKSVADEFSPSLFFLLLFFVVLFGIATSGDHSKIEKDQNGCRVIPRVGLVCND